jgi:hypothetical protein
MLRFAINLVISVAVIVGATWLSRRHPGTAGFVAALPITTMLVLVLGRVDGVAFDEQVRFTRSLLAGIPLATTFLVPFVFAPRFGISFWASFGLGLVCLAIAYAFHRSLFGA